MNPGFPRQTSSIYYPTSALQQQTAYGQSAINGPNPAGTVQHERINITRTIRTQGLKPDLHCFHSEQPSSNSLQPGRVRADYTQQPYFNQQPLHHLTANQYSNATLTAGSKPYQPIQAHQITQSTNPFPSPNSYPDVLQWNQTPVKSITDPHTEDEITELLNELYDSQSVAPLNQMFETGSVFSTRKPASIYASHSIYPGTRLSGTTESVFLPFSQGSHACHQPAVTNSGFRIGKNAEAMGYGQLPLAPTIAKSENFILSPPLSSPRKRPQNPDLNHQAKIGASLPKKPSLYNTTYSSNPTMSSSGAHHTHLYAASQMRQRADSNELQHMATARVGCPAAKRNYFHKQQMAHQAETSLSCMVQNLPTPLEQNPAGNPLPPGQSPMPEHSADSYPAPVSSRSDDQPGSSSLNAPVSKSAPQGFDTLQQSMGCPDTKARKTSEGTQQQIPTPASTVTDDSDDQIDFNWQAPEFHRKSEEILSLTRETQNILGIQNLDLPWITTAHVFIIAADTIDGIITETLMYILRLAHLKSRPNEPDNPLENVNQEIAKVVNDWYAQSEEDKIETEYFELLNSINRHRRTQGKLPLHKNASYSRILNTAAEILKSERSTKGSHHLPPRHERAYLTEYIQSALNYIQSGLEGSKPSSNK